MTFPLSGDDHQLFDEMPPRNSASSREHQLISAITPRRSQRLLEKNHGKPEDPKTPDPESKTIHICHFATPLTAPQKGSLNKPFQSNKAEERAHGLELNENLSTGLRRSAALSANAGPRRSASLSGNLEVCVLPKSLNQSHDIAELAATDCELDAVKTPQYRKRVTRSSGRPNVVKCVKNILEDRFDEVGSSCFEVSEDGVAEVRVNSGVSSSKKLQRKLGKRVKGSSNGSNDNRCAKNTCGDGFHEMGNSCVEASEERVFTKREKCRVSPSKKSLRKLGKRVASSMATRIVKEKGTDIDKGTKVLQVKRKRKQIEESTQIAQGWTKDQELALRRAYFAAKPTPHFWKKVSKLVPGKTAQDCFDKINADHSTPPQPRTRTRARTSGSQSSVSASRLLKSSEPKAKRLSYKQKSRVAHKTVRQMLENHYKVDQHYEADLFSVLEGASTPECGLGKPQYMKKSAEKSSSASKKQRSRLGISPETALVSPPVLKQVKNKALHEKYIDKLHTRDAQRRAASAHTSTVVPVMNPLKLDAVKAAKNALVLDAKDVIHQFQHLKGSSARKSSDFDDDDEEMDWDDEEGADDIF